MSPLAELAAICVATLVVGYGILSFEVRRVRARDRSDALMARLGPYRTPPEPVMYVCAGPGCRGCATALADDSHPGWVRLARDVAGDE